MLSGYLNPGTDQSSSSAMDSYCLLIVLGFVAQAAAHGRFIEPPSRASAWRFGFDTPVNWDDNELNCGGIGVSISTKFPELIEFVYQKTNFFF